MNEEIKGKDLINHSSLSELLTGKKYNIRKDKTPLVHLGLLNDLIGTIDIWIDENKSKFKNYKG